MEVSIMLDICTYCLFTLYIRTAVLIVFQRLIDVFLSHKNNVHQKLSNELNDKTRTTAIIVFQWLMFSYLIKTMPIRN